MCVYLFIYMFLSWAKRINKRADVARAGQLLFICYLAANFANWSVCVCVCFVVEVRCCDLCIQLQTALTLSSGMFLMERASPFYFHSLQVLDLQKCWLWLSWNSN